MCLVAPLLVVPVLRDFEDLPKRIWLQGGSLILLGFILTEASREGVIRLRRCVLYLPLSLVTVWSLLSLTWSRDLNSAALQWLHWAACGALFFSSLQVIASATQFRRILHAITIGGALIAVLGVSQYFFGFSGIKQQLIPGATFNNPNMAGQFAVIAIPAALGSLIFSKRTTPLVLSSIVLGLLLVFLYCTFARAAWLAVACELILIGGTVGFGLIAGKGRPSFINRRHALRLAGAAVIVLFAFHLSPQGWYWPEATWLQPFGYHPHGGKPRDDVDSNLEPPSHSAHKRKRVTSTGTFGIRFRLWENALVMMAQRPWLGTGLDNFHVYYPQATLQGVTDPTMSLHRRPRQAHNDFLQISVELGTLMPAMVVSLVIMGMVRRLRRTCIQDLSFDGLVLAAIAAAPVVGLLVNALFSFPLYRALPPAILAVFTAALTRAVGGFSTQDSDAVSIPFKDPVRLILSWIALALVASGWLLVQTREAIANAHFKKQMHALTQDHDWEQVIVHGTKAMAWAPLATEPRALVGRALAKKREFDKAEALLQEALDREPYAPSILFDLADCYRQLGRYDEAKRLLEQAVSILPEEGEIHGSLGRVALKQNQTQAALGHFRKATRFMPRNGYFHFQQANAAYELRIFKEARKAYKRCLRKRGNWLPYAHRNLGMLLISELGRPKAGAKHLKQALLMNPRFADAAEMKALVEQAASAATRGM